MEDGELVARGLLQGPATAVRGMALGGLVLGLAVAHSLHPELYSSHVPAVIDAATGTLHISGRPHPHWNDDNSVLAQMVDAARSGGTEQLADCVRENVATLVENGLTHILLFGEWDLSNLLPALLRQADLDWCRQTLGWRSCDVARKMRDVNRLVSHPADRRQGTGFLLSHPSAVFRMYAVGMAQDTPDQCAGCGRGGRVRFKCGACGKRRYCDTACQARHWRTHKAECVGLRGHTLLTEASFRALQDSVAQPALRSHDGA